MKSEPESLSNALRNAIIRSGLTMLEIQRHTGVNNAVIGRFVRGERGLNLTSADVLARFFRLVLVEKGGRTICPSKKRKSR